MEIKEISDHQEIPLSLLLLADPEIDHINKYLSKSRILAAIHRNEIVGIIIFKATNNETVEIMNIAVLENHQWKGIGKKLILNTFLDIKNNGFKKVQIGTGNTSVDQLAFYQKMGFRIANTIHNYFVDNYKNKIFENGKQCKDMIRLEKYL